MELIGVSRTLSDGTTQDEFVVRCEIHDWYFKGQPPITHGCRECWHAYYFTQIARSEGDKYTNFAQLESAINHAAESIDKGEWDFKPDYSINISHEN